MVDLHQGSINFISEIEVGTTSKINISLHIKVSINEQNFSN